jgi:hypothetical protein
MFVLTTSLTEQLFRKRELAAVVVASWRRPLLSPIVRLVCPAPKPDGPAQYFMASA